MSAHEEPKPVATLVYADGSEPELLYSGDTVTAWLVGSHSVAAGRYKPEEWQGTLTAQDKRASFARIGEVGAAILSHTEVKTVDFEQSAKASFRLDVLRYYQDPSEASGYRLARVPAVYYFGHLTVLAAQNQ